MLALGCLVGVFLFSVASAIPTHNKGGSHEQKRKQTCGLITNLRLIDLSLDALVAASSSSKREEGLQTLQGGGHDPRKRGFTLFMLANYDDYPPDQMATAVLCFVLVVAWFVHYVSATRLPN